MSESKVPFFYYRSAVKELPESRINNCHEGCRNLDEQTSSRYIVLASSDVILKYEISYFVENLLYDAEHIIILNSAL